MNTKRMRAKPSKAIHSMGGPDLQILSNRVQAEAQLKATKTKGTPSGSEPMKKRPNRTGGPRSGGL